MGAEAGVGRGKGEKEREETRQGRRAGAGGAQRGEDEEREQGSTDKKISTGGQEREGMGSRRTRKDWVSPESYAAQDVD